MPIALLALALSAFAIGTTEFVIVGPIPTIAADLAVSLPSGGLLVSLYALGVAVVGLGAVAVVGSLLFVPRGLAHREPASLGVQARVLAEPRLLLVYATTAIGYGGCFIPFTCLASILSKVSGFFAGAVAWLERRRHHVHRWHWTCGECPANRTARVLVWRRTWPVPASPGGARYLCKIVLNTKYNKTIAKQCVFVLGV